MTFKFCIIVALIFSANANVIKEEDIDIRIVGGYEAVEDVLPYVALIINKETNEVICGSTILNGDWVMTLASKIDGVPKENIMIKGGFVNVTDGETVQNVEVGEIHKHPNYNSENPFRFNVALIKVSKPFSINAHVQGIRIAESTWDLQGRTGHTGGAGSGGEMKYTSVKLDTNEECSKAYERSCAQDEKPLICQKEEKYSEYLLCTDHTNKDDKSGICDKDIGGPVTILNEQYDYVAGINLATIGECGQGMSIYLNIGPLNDFIYSLIQKNE